MSAAGFLAVAIFGYHARGMGSVGDAMKRFAIGIFTSALLLGAGEATATAAQTSGCVVRGGHSYYTADRSYYVWFLEGEQRLRIDFDPHQVHATLKAYQGTALTRDQMRTYEETFADLRAAAQTGREVLVTWNDKSGRVSELTVFWNKPCGGAK